MDTPNCCHMPPRHFIRHGTPGKSGIANIHLFDENRVNVILVKKNPGNDCYGHLRKIADLPDIENPGLTFICWFNW